MNPPASWTRAVVVGLLMTVVTAVVTLIPGLVAAFMAATAFDGCFWECEIRNPSPAAGVAWSVLAALLVFVAPLAAGLVTGWAERTGRRRPQQVVILLVCAPPVLYFGMIGLAQLA